MSLKRTDFDWYEIAALSKLFGYQATKRINLLLERKLLKKKYILLRCQIAYYLQNGHAEGRRQVWAGNSGILLKLLSGDEKKEEETDLPSTEDIVLLEVEDALVCAQHHFLAGDHPHVCFIEVRGYVFTLPQTQILKTLLLHSYLER